MSGSSKKPMRRAVVPVSKTLPTDPQDQHSSSEEVDPIFFTPSPSPPSNTPTPDNASALPCDHATGEPHRHPNPTRHPDFWFHDGSIILQVESKLFKIHQTILANHSEVFAGLFDVPPPLPTGTTEGDDMVLEGCRIVVLHGDTEKDFESLLRAVYNPSYFDDTLPPSADVETLLDFISGILHLSTKYLIRNLRQRCINLFTSKFPATFDEYTAKSTPQPSYSSTRSSSHKQERYRSDTLMRALHLAHSCNITTSLPYLYYCTARLSLHRLLKPRPTDVDWQTKSVVLAGRERLRYATLAISYSFLLVFERAPTCAEMRCGFASGPGREWRSIVLGGESGIGSAPTPPTAATSITNAGGVNGISASATAERKSKSSSNRAPNPLRLYTRWPELGVCDRCVEWNKGVHERGRREVWERLPGMFELEGWDELRKAQGS
ncbi:hypothetical protein CC1G_00139 [Coprinopsis cinerea okayama7|uniref:BTB domain-containing protein n=1 Tax=Coprinopsis cinerea (strain Okayama-7 / 130 / ATCC MYA-4618 / FGSC 9003) TaxID=240176 RepID=A8NWW7_COPC7|nr:hypothetical protein CC1G_00139 [Coprinopsis cinerea okayama7\|eukprot:XP_001837003.1 hypothetical protein CC1G_00139 [Coprinopsis cinerea okayama7\